MQRATLQPALGVESHALESEAVLFDEHGQRMFHLNSTAACIWNHIQHGGDPTLAAREIAASLAIDEATALVYVREIAERWSDLKILDDGQPMRDERLSRPPCIVTIPGGGCPTNFTVASRRDYVVLDTVVSLNFTENLLEKAVHPTLCHLEVTESRPADLTIDVVTTAQGYEIRCNGDRLGRCVSLSGVAPLVHAHIFHLSIGRAPHVMALHSGALACLEGCLLMPASSGSGKSTLTAALCRAGWLYMADDIVLLQHDSLNAVGVPNALGIKAGAWKILESRYPELATVAVHERGDGKRIRYITPSDWLNSGAIERRPTRWILFPRYQPGMSAKISPLSAADGFCRLMAHCCGLPQRLTQEDVNGMIRWIADIACFELAFSDLDAAVRAITASCVRPAQTTVSMTSAGTVLTA